MEILDVRRLTGPNLQTLGPAAIAEVAFGPAENPKDMTARWKHHLETVCEHLPFDSDATAVRYYDGGAAWVLRAPVDSLYAATTAIEWASQQVAHEVSPGDSIKPIESIVEQIHAELKTESNPRLLELERECETRNIPFLWDDELVSIGYGRHSQTWAARDLPSLEDISWDSLKSIPILVITGTNGKTTTSRLLTRIALSADLTVGNSSTDGVSVNEKVIEDGDWTGPGAARTVLRQAVDIAVLETARGGILRRGLGIPQCDGAIVTNVSRDHMHEYGINRLQEMAQAKGVVYSIVSPSGRRVINADDPSVLSQKDNYDTPITLTSLDFDHPALKEHRSQGGDTVALRENILVFSRGEQHEDLIQIQDAPLTMGGAARYNIANALGAIALAKCVDIPNEAIEAGLRSFGKQWSDNPGRGQIASSKGVHILLDFGHNPEGIKALLELVKGIYSQQNREGRLSVCVGQAGDRSDEDILALTDAISKAPPSRVFLRELPNHLRGRELGEVPNMFRERFIRNGVSQDVISQSADEVDALRQALDWAEPGDIVMHLVHLERQPVREFLDTIDAEWGLRMSPTNA